MLKEMTVEHFVREVASSSPSPGGGSAAALSAAQAAALLSMYCNLSQNRQKLGDVVDSLQQAGEEARFLKKKLLEAIDEEMVVFNLTMKASRLPKNNLSEKESRNKALRDAALQAEEVPLQTARGALRILSMIAEVAVKGNPAAITDLGVANLQAFAGLKGACYNARANLGMIGDTDKLKELDRETEELVAQGRSFFEQNLSVIEEEISRYLN
ncbi:MAG: cyclodeaminase/cyclohydrolase family protein [Bacillota bacterium]|nr:cyclodeaminase/cyclohydrolase family protein [Bacillota bacterium]